MAATSDINQRVAYLRSMLDSDRDIPQKTIIANFTERFGHGLSFVAIKQCKVAHAKGKFSEVAVPLFTRLVQRASKQPTKKTAKKAAKKAAKPVSAPQPDAAAGPKAAPKKTRGERRKKIERAGRRKADKKFIEAGTASNHLVLVMEEGRVIDHRFKAKRDAEACINELIAKGVSPTKITYYQRQEVSYKISI